MPTSCRSGTSSERFFKLCTRAPRTSMAVGSVKARGVGVAATVAVTGSVIGGSWEEASRFPSSVTLPAKRDRIGFRIATDAEFLESRHGRVSGCPASFWK